MNVYIGLVSLVFVFLNVILNVLSSTHKRSRLWVFTGITVIASTSLSGCADFEPLTRSEIPNDAQLSISPSGKQVFLFRKEPGKYGKMDGRLITIEDGKSKEVREIKLPDYVLSTNWAFEEDQILVSSSEASEFILWKININTNEKKDIYRSKMPITFLHEFTPERFIFLEAYGESSGRKYSTWQVLENGMKRELSNRPFGLAANLSRIRENLFLYPPDRNIFYLEGKFTGYPTGVLDQLPWSLDCQGEKHVMCTQGYLKRYKTHFYSGTYEFIGEDGRCMVPGEWFGASNHMMSRDGETFVFHARKDFDSKDRNIFLVRFSSGSCLVNELLNSGGIK